jgi:hypothetical protein
MIAFGLLSLTLLASIISGFQVWLSQQPAWPLFKSCLAGFLCALLLTIIMLGREFNWWQIDGELLDKVAMMWIALTVGVIGVTYWLVR